MTPELRRALKLCGKRGESYNGSVFRDWFDTVLSPLYPQFLRQCKEKGMNRLECLNALMEHLNPVIVKYRTIQWPGDWSKECEFGVDRDFEGVSKIGYLVGYIPGGGYLDDGGNWWQFARIKV